MRIPRVSLKGQPVPLNRFAEFAPHKVHRLQSGEVDNDPVVERSDTPAAREAVAVLARRSRVKL